MKFWKLALMSLALFIPVCAIAAEGDAADADAADAEEEKPYDERGLIRDDMRVSLAFTQGSNEYYDYTDLRVYIAGQAHYAFSGDDYLDVNLLLNRFDRSYDDPRYGDEPLTNLFDMDVTYVFDGVDKYEYGVHHALGATFFSANMFEDVNLGVGYGGVYRYPTGNVRLLAGLGRNIGFDDAWEPMAELSMTHNKRLNKQWRLITKADLMWHSGEALLNGDGATYPDTVYVLNGTIYYQLIKNWSLYARYLNDNAADSPRSYISLGLSHNFRPPRKRPTK